jgi:hypothetical protein
MTNAIPLRFGQVSADELALFLKMYGGETLAAFEEANLTVGRHLVRSISSGKQAQFPATGKINAQSHVPGAAIQGQTSAVAERIINIDDLIIAPVFLGKLDEAMTHYEVRSIYSTEAGRALAYRWDRNVLQAAVLAARSSTPLPSQALGGQVLTSSGTLYRTSAVDLAAGIYGAMQGFAERDIPASQEKNCFVRPAQYYLLAQSTALLNRDWGGSGSYGDGTIPRIGGANILMTNHLPITNLTGTYLGADRNGLAANFSTVAAAIFTPYAVGTVKLLDLSVETEYQVWRQGTLIVASYAVGTGILRNDCAAVLQVA